MPAPTIYIIAGCNGAGKTTFAREFLLKEVACVNFLNADYLALGLSPLSPEIAAMKAGRLLLTEFKSLVARGETFALESTLSGLTYVRLLRDAKRRRFRIYLHYLWLPTSVIAIARVRERVKKGGHNVPVLDITRRFGRSLRHSRLRLCAAGESLGGLGQPKRSPQPARRIGKLFDQRFKGYYWARMKNGRRNDSNAEFLAAARRAFKRVARRLVLENRRLGLPLVFGKNGRVLLVKPSSARLSLSAEVRAKADVP